MKYSGPEVHDTNICEHAILLDHTPSFVTHWQLHGIGQCPEYFTAVTDQEEPR